MPLKNIFTCTDGILIYLTFISLYKIILCYKAKIIFVFKGLTIKTLQQTEGDFIRLNKDNRIDFHIGRQDITDHRKAPDKKTSLSVEGAEIREDFPRLSIGRIALRPAGKIIYGTMRQDLWNAEIRGTIVTDLGEITFRAVTPYYRMLNIVEVTSTEKKSGLHITPVASPEYIAKDGNRLYKNTSYTLALIRWLLNSLIEVSEKTGTEIPRMETWKNILDNLIDFPVDENGLMIGSDQSVDQSHRHYSHLLALYPLYQLNPDSPVDSLLVDKSVDHWHKIDDGKNLSGYSYTGAASLYAALGRGDDALPNIQRFLTGDIGWIGRFFPNTFYAETYGKSPCFESPMSAASAIAELLLQSWGGKIRVFPAMPSGWEQACFHHMRGQGGFLVSASRDDSKTSWVKIKSLRGEPCIVKIPYWEKAVQVSGGRRITITPLGTNEFSIDLNAGEQVLLSPGDSKINAIIKPVRQPAQKQNLFGVKKGENLEEEMVWPEVCPVTGIEY